MRYRLGMVLSGGGVRGLAHVGALEALAEEGIEPEALAGTSAGAIVAALHAAGYTPKEMLEFFATKHPFKVSKLALSKSGIFDTDKVVADFREYFPEDSFEALGKPIFLTATDLVRARPEIFSSGRLIPAILASASTPLIFTPTGIEGRWYSDGGILNNFPTEPLLGHCDVILGVYASPLRERSEDDLESSLAVMHRSFEIGMYFASRQKFHQCDLVLCPPELSAYSTFGTKHMEEIFEVGYRDARRRMDEIRGVIRDARASRAAAAAEEPR